MFGVLTVSYELKEYLTVTWTKCRIICSCHRNERLDDLCCLRDVLFLFSCHRDELLDDCDELLDDLAVTVINFWMI